MQESRPKLDEGGGKSSEASRSESSPGEKSSRNNEPRNPVKMILFFLFVVTLVYVAFHVIWLREAVPGVRVAHVESSIKLLIGVLAVILLREVQVRK